MKPKRKRVFPIEILMKGVRYHGFAIAQFWIKMKGEQWCMRPELVLFDMDGLIFDSERLFMEALGEVMAEQGYTLTKKVYVETLGTAGENLARIMHSHYGEGYDVQKTGHVARERMDQKVAAGCQGLPIKKGILELLVYLVEQDIPCMVASSTKSCYVERYLQEAGIDWYFNKGVIGGEMVQHSKPDPEIFLLACEKAGVEPEHVLVLEDSENGIRAAHAGRIPVICIPDLRQPSQEVAEMAEAILSDGLAVIDYLQK